MGHATLGLLLLSAMLARSAVKAVRCEDITEGGWLDEDCIVRSNTLIKKDLFVEKSTKLTVNPGVELSFVSGVMLAVNGTLKAEVI